MTSPSESIRTFAQDRLIIKCNACDAGNENEAEYYCGECNQYLCVSCEKSHKKFLKNHKLVTPFQGRGIQNLNLTTTCLTHNKTFSFYCKHCNVNICIVCQTEQHASHKLIIIDKHAKMLKTDLLGQINKLEQCLPGVKQKSDKVKKHLSNFDTVIEKQVRLVETETAKIRTALEAQSAKLIQFFRKEQETARGMIKDQIVTIDGLKRDVENLTTKIKAEIGIAPEAGMLQYFNDTQTMLDTRSTKIRLTLPNPSTFTPASLGDQLSLGTTHSAGNTDHIVDTLGGASTTQSPAPVDPPPSMRRELSVLHELSLGGSVVSCTTDGSSCWVGVNTDLNSGEVQLIDKHGEQMLTVKLPHGVDYTALTSTGDLLVSGDNTTKITRVTRQGDTRTFIDIAAQSVKCVSGLVATQQDDIFVCIRMTGKETKDKVIKLSFQGEGILQVSQHFFTSNKLEGMHKISRDTLCIQDGRGQDADSRLVIIDSRGLLLSQINRSGDLQTETRTITGDRHGHIIAGTDTWWDGYIHVCSDEGVCLYTYALPWLSGMHSFLSQGMRGLSVGEDDVIWVGTSRGKLIVAKYLEELHT